MLEGIQFGELGKNRADKNFIFYLEVLRNFISDNQGKIIWVKGGVGEREACLIFRTEIHDRAKEFWMSKIGRRTYHALRALDNQGIRDILVKCRFGKRLYVGSLLEECVTPSDGAQFVEPYFCEFCNAIGSEGTWCNVDHRKPIP